MIRPVLPEDREFLLQVAQECYPGHDLDLIDRWLQVTIDPRPEVLFLRSDNGAVLAQRTDYFWAPEDPEVHLIFLGVRPRARPSSLEGFKLLRTVIECARGMGASFCFGSSTGVDFTPYAKMLGAVQEAPSFKVEWPRGQEDSRDNR